MSNDTRFPPLAGWEPTRKTLHLYSNVIGVVPRAHAQFHPKWWHISLKVQPDGLTTDSIPLPGGGVFSLKMDLRRHDIVLVASRGVEQRWSMTRGTSATALGNQALAAVAELGLSGDYARQKFENDEPRLYDPAAAERFLTALVSADKILKQHRASLKGQVGPVQLWPHGFDIAFEWFGTRLVQHDEKGKMQELPAQINFGFYPGEPIYFYANPWPFEKEKLVQHPLPGGARWHDQGWQGTMLPYAEVVNDPGAEERLLAYYRAVYDIASPALLA